jgi:Tfp pilus assembly protein PilF
VAAAPTETSAADPGGDGFRPRTESAVDDEPAMTRDDMVQRARRAFWNGDPEGAEAAYLDLITAYPGDADAFGELGNLYESTGRPDAARDAFFEAGLRLKANAESEKLNKIIDLLRREGDPRADQLTP